MINILTASDDFWNFGSPKLLIKIRIQFNKRYITLAPVANLIGLAFNLEDPDKLLQQGQPGVTLALIESSHSGLVKDTHHNPLNRISQWYSER